MDYKPEMYSKPEIYSKNIILQVLAAEKALARFFKSDDKSDGFPPIKALDVACGEGTITSMLKATLGKTAKLDACDISQEVLGYAESKYGYLGIDFFLMDACKPVRSHLKESYDIIFSNFFLHWARDQRAVMQNFKDLLKEGGKFILTFVAKQTCYKVYRVLAKNSQWSKYMEDVERFISPYQDINDPEEVFSNLLHDLKFVNVKVQCEEIVIKCTFSSQKAVLQSIDPFYQRLPEELRDGYMHDYIAAYIHNGGFINFDPNTGPEDLIEIPSMVIFAYAEKTMK